MVLSRLAVNADDPLNPTPNNVLWTSPRQHGSLVVIPVTSQHEGHGSHLIVPAIVSQLPDDATVIIMSGSLFSGELSL